MKRTGAGQQAPAGLLTWMVLVEVGRLLVEEGEEEDMFVKGKTVVTGLK